MRRPSGTSRARTSPARTSPARTSRTRRVVQALAVVLRLGLAATVLVGPLAAFTVAISENGILPKRGAGLVLFVSLQRQSMS